MKQKTQYGEAFMALALRQARRGMIRREGGPFGACIVRKRRVIALAHNTVLKSNDPTRHAEVNAIRRAAHKLGRFRLDGCTLYSTTEPCPMCFSAIHWARIDCVVFGTRFQDVKRRGFHEMNVPAAFLKRKGKSSVRIESGFLKKECLELLREWDRLPHKRTY